MFEWKRIRRNKKIFDDLSLRFNRATFSNGNPFYDLFKLELIENEKSRLDVIQDYNEKPVNE